ncbi:isopentenyl transferases protein [Artemisia annua]|uniref:adenylate dimethylallyltransferase (ADP/ATP-dependent) n=1 Tax=Artemisia annua TaxID=35608 RepID=A0A2U1N7F5_ARTAN|nr:isopentenyl transferases protein [Artemisia annua]
MKMTMMLCQQAQPSLLQMPTGRMDLSALRHRSQKDKVVVVVGATGTGKSRLSIDLATRYSAEIINSDKIQVYEGLDIVTNKMTYEECEGVPHHLLGIVDPEADFTAQNFVSTASLTMKSIVGRGKLPIIAGGSNSFIEALIDDQNYEFRSRYDVCFLWVDVAMPVLHRFVSDRVDRMVSAGIVEEVREMYRPNSDYSKGIRRAIGVPEFDAYFREEYSSSSDENTRKKLLEEAINQTKINTCKLACRQLEKIRRLQKVKGWEIRRLDATPVFQKQGQEADELWAESVVGPGSVIVNQFLHNICYPQSFPGATDYGRRGNKRATPTMSMVTATVNKRAAPTMPMVAAAV